jgi:hypothetical protein
MIGKEYLYVLEEIAKTHRQIYDDACDIGTYATPALDAKIRSALDSLKEFEGGKASSFGSTKSYTVRLGVEMAGPETVDGYEITVSKTELSKAQQRQPRHQGATAFYAIEIRRVHWPKGERLGSR